MKDNLYNITFSPYNSQSSVMRIGCGERYFIISNAKRHILDEIFSGKDEKLKAEMYKKIQHYARKDKDFVSVQDFQYKKEIIGKDIIATFTRYFSFLYNKYVCMLVLLTISVLFTYFYVLNPPQNLSSVLSFDYSWLLIMFQYMK